MTRLDVMPPTLLAPPPRDPRTAGEVLINKPFSLLKLLPLFVLAPPTFALALWVLAGPSDLTVGLILGIVLDSILTLFIAAFLLQRNRATVLFRDGTATEGTVQQVPAPADSRGYGFLKVEYRDDSGRTHTVTFPAMGAKRSLNVNIGDPITVVYLPTDPCKCGFYTPGLGIVPGRA